MTTGSVATDGVATGTVSTATGSTATSSVATDGTVPDSAAQGKGAATSSWPRARTDGRDGGNQLRDIEELVAKLAIVTRQLALPARTMPSPRYADAPGQQAARDS